jgi:hypothetical protein
MLKDALSNGKIALIKSKEKSRAFLLGRQQQKMGRKQRNEIAENETRRTVVKRQPEREKRCTMRSTEELREI